MAYCRYRFTESLANNLPEAAAALIGTDALRYTRKSMVFAVLTAAYTHADLAGLPCLLIVVERARMGDTLPRNFAYGSFDVRARYRDGVPSLATFRQDIGRACGFALSISSC